MLQRLFDSNLIKRREEAIENNDEEYEGICLF